MKKDKKSMHKSNSTFTMTADEIFKTIKRLDEVGIYGYNCPKEYFDAKKQLWEKKRAEILESHKGQWPPEEWKADKETGKKIPPKKWNFIDDQIKWAKSFYDPKKGQELKESLEAKGNKIGEEIPYKSDFDIKKNDKNLRSAFNDREKELEGIREKIKAIPDWKQTAIDEVKEKMKSDNEHKAREKKSSWGKGDKVMYNEESQYIGELIPFWNPNSKEEDKTKAEFKPNKLKFLHKSPSWIIGPKKKKGDENDEKSPSSYLQAANEKIEEKANQILEKMGVTRKTYFEEPVLSFYKVNNHGQLPHLIRKVFDYSSTDQYKAAKEKKACETPAPNSYWDDGKCRIKLRKNIEDDKAAKYVMPREKTYKRLYNYGLRRGIY